MRNRIYSATVTSPVEQELRFESGQADINEPTLTRLGSWSFSLLEIDQATTTFLHKQLNDGQPLEVRLVTEKGTYEGTALISELPLSSSSLGSVSAAFFEGTGPVKKSSE